MDKQSGPLLSCAWCDRHGHGRTYAFCNAHPENRATYGDRTPDWCPLLPGEQDDVRARCEVCACGNCEAEEGKAVADEAAMWQLRAQEAEAKLAAWEPTIREALAHVDDYGEASGCRCPYCLAAQIPPEHRPEGT